MKNIINIFILIFFSIYINAQVIKRQKNNDNSLYLSAGILIFAGISTHISTIIIDKKKFQEEFQENFSFLSSSSDEYLPYIPIITVYSFNIFKNQTKNTFIEKSILLLKSEILNYVIVNSIKRITKIERPDKSDKLAFPSGHTSNAFVLATFMDKELREKSKLFSVLAYSLASVTGILRILNNKHWLPDVMLGAGIGILSTTLSYKTHNYKWTKNKNLKNFFIFPKFLKKEKSVCIFFKF